MNRSKVTIREMVLLVLLCVLLISVIYYMGFYGPLQEEINSLALRSAEVDSQIQEALVRVRQKNTMEQELEEILARPQKEITEFAPYDNKEAVLDMLYGILGKAEDYSLSFTDPAVKEDGTVRREISMKFRCGSYATAKQVVRELSRCRWRCLITSCSIADQENWLEEEELEEGVDYNDMMHEPVDVDMTVTFFESTRLK